MRHYRFVNYYWRTFFKPHEAFSEILLDKGYLRFSALAVLITASLYTCVYIFLILGGGQPFKPWLDIEPKIYYQYNVVFCAPSMFLGWILAAGVVHILSRVITSTGTFEQVLCVFGMGLSVASWSTGIHDLITSFLGAIHIINQHHYELALNSPTVWRTILWILMVIYLVWFIFLFTRGVKAVYGLSKGYSMLLGFMGFVIYQSFFFIFNR